ncbi:MAG: HD domain-containing phosphohydrolase [Blastocatellia bacterium]
MMFASGHVRSGHLAELYYTDERGEQRQINLSSDVFTIGRNRDNDLSINNAQLSRYHAEIVFDGEHFVFVDRNSRAGSFCGEERVVEKPLHDGDRIRLGTGEKSPVVTFFRTTPENPCLIPAAEETLFIEEDLEENVPLETYAVSLQSVPSLINVRRLNAIGDQLREAGSRAEIFQVLRNALEFVFPAAQVRVSSDTAPEISGRYVQTGVLAAGERVHGYWAIGGQSRNFSDDEADFILALGQQAGQALELSRLKEEKQRSFDSLIKALALALDARDELTAGHSARVANYSSAIARHMELSAREQKLIYYAALLHDYGKIGIRDEVLCKPSGLTPEEYEHIKQHPSFTFHILSRINFGEEMAGIPQIASSHHERPDGLGYPRGLRGEEIPLGSLIIAVADFFDALTAKRHYRQPMPTDEVIKIIEAGRDTQFDGIVIDAFKRYYEMEYRPRRLRHQQHRQCTGEQNVVVGAFGRPQQEAMPPMRQAAD